MNINRLGYTESSLPPKGPRFTPHFVGGQAGVHPRWRLNNHPSLSPQVGGSARDSLYQSFGNAASDFINTAASGLQNYATQAVDSSKMNDAFKQPINDLIGMGSNYIRGFSDRMRDPGFIQSFHRRVNPQPNP